MVDDVPESVFERKCPLLDTNTQPQLNTIQNLSQRIEQCLALYPNCEKCLQLLAT